MNNRTRNATAAGATAFLLALACRDATAPTLQQRLAGTYDLTTTLQTHTYSVGCGLVPCRDTTAANDAATLFGTITVGDSVVNRSDRSTFPVYSASMHQSRDGTQGWVADYGGTSDGLNVTGDTLGAVFYGASSGLMITLGGTFAGDSIVGNLSWYPYLGCCAVDYYSGTFVAHRRP